MKVQVSGEFGGRTVTFTTGEIAKQASGCVVLQYGETTLLTAAQSGPGREGQDFFPLTVDYRERLAAAGKFPGGFIKREGRPTQREILTCRLTDRPIRPLFPKGYFDEVQIQINVMSCDGQNDPDIWAINSASAALMVAPVPFRGPIAGVRVGLIDGEFVLLPSYQDMKNSRLDLVVAGSLDSILMIEGFGDQIPEDVMVDALMFGHEAIKGLCKLQIELARKAGVQRPEYVAPPENPFLEEVRKELAARLRDARQNPVKAERSSAASAVRDEYITKVFPAGVDALPDGRTKAQLKDAIYKVDKDVCRKLTLAGKRLDGRTPTELRKVECHVDVIPYVHGSSLFTRGETQSLNTLVLGSTRDAQKVENLFEETAKNFMLDYNFPSYSVGEVRPIRGPGRREIGHGALAERSIAPVLPKVDTFPYTIRVISDITESNGSSSMASVCSTTLSLMAGGVPITQPVAGISIGLVKEGSDYVLLTDIIGDEDHFGDMDFKVAGSQKGITGIQLDLKIDGINKEIITRTLEQARDTRRELLRLMLLTIRRPRAELSSHAPRVLSTKIDVEKIGLLIGPSGKTIRAMQSETGTTIDVQDDGTVTISGPNRESCDSCMARVEALTEDIKVGRIYTGKVNSIKDFGAFVEIAPGKDGLLHISELSDGFVKSVTDIVKIGDLIEVKVIAVDDQNRVKLSRKAILAAKAAEQPVSDDDDEEDDLDDDDDDFDDDEE